MDIEIIIADVIAKFRDCGYVVKAEYTLSSNGDAISIKLVFCGRLE